MTANEAYVELSVQLCQLYPEREASNIADWVLEYLTGKKKWARRMDHVLLTERQEDQYRSFSIELLSHKPVQYVLGEAFFCGMRFYVDESVLIPRPETEELVKLVIDENSGGANLRILEIGSGSGCIPIAIKRQMPAAFVTSVDISEPALSVARKNASGLQADVQFRQLNFLDETTWPTLEKYDIIVSNPPYIPETEKAMLDKHVTDFEPGIALFVSDTDPFIFYRKIAAFATDNLLAQGKVYLEVHEEYAHQVLAIFKGTFRHCKIVNDIYGKERMVVARFEV